MPNSPDAKMIANEIKDLGRKLDSLSRQTDNAAKALARALHPSNTPNVHKNENIFDDAIPVVLDWESPEIQGQAFFVRNRDGHVEIVILVDPNETERVLGLLDSGFVQALQLCSVEPL